MMKILRILIVSVVVGAALVFVALTSSSTTTTTFPAVIFPNHQNIGIVTASRKLKENHYNIHSEMMKRDAGNVNLEDYGISNPNPSACSSTREGPIEHGTPLNPYVPKPGPPSNPGFTNP